MDVPSRVKEKRERERERQTDGKKSIAMSSRPEAKKLVSWGEHEQVKLLTNAPRDSGELQMGPNGIPK